MKKHNLLILILFIFSFCQILSSQETKKINTYETIEFCLGDELILDAKIEDADYEWSTEEYDKEISVYDAGKYTCELYYDGKYLGKKVFNVVYKKGPTINRVVPVKDEIRVYASQEGDYEFSLNGFKFQKSNIFKDLKTGAYNFYARHASVDSCQAHGPAYRYIKF